MKERHVLGEGARRLVYDLGNGYVIKLAKTDNGILNNRTEVAIYRQVPYRLRRNLARIVSYASGYEWLIMLRYGRKFPKSRKYRRRLKRIKDRFRKFGILPYEMFGRSKPGPNYQNLRTARSGKIVVIDYGNFKFKKNFKFKEKPETKAMVMKPESTFAPAVPEPTLLLHEASVSVPEEEVSS